MIVVHTFIAIKCHQPQDRNLQEAVCRTIYCCSTLNSVLCRLLLFGTWSCVQSPRTVSWRKLSQSIANRGHKTWFVTPCVLLHAHTEPLYSVLLLASNSCSSDRGWENGGCSKICSQSRLFVDFLSCWVSVKSHCSIWKSWSHTLPGPLLALCMWKQEEMGEQLDVNTSLQITA